MNTNIVRKLAYMAASSTASRSSSFNTNDRTYMAPSSVSSSLPSRNLHFTRMDLNSVTEGQERCVIVDSNNRPATVTFAKPLVSHVLEIETPTMQQNFVFPSVQSTGEELHSNNGLALSPILAGHPNYHISHELNNSPAVCRICYSGEESGPREGEPLISPCHCKGTMGLYHRTCLNKWLAVSQKIHCEICQFKFQIKRTSPSFCAYLRAGRACSMLGVQFRFRASLLTDFLCFLLLSPLVFLSASVCFLSGWHLIQNNDGFQGPRLEIGIGLFCLSTLLLIAYFIWLGVTVFFHQRAFHSWQSRNWNYSVVDQLSMEESVLVNGGRSGGRRRRNPS